MTPLLILGPAGCTFGGGGGGKDGGKDGGGKTTAQQAADDMTKMRKYAQCMRENGVPMVDPQTDGHGGITVGVSGSGAGKAPDKQTMDKAQSACSRLMPNGGKPPKAKPEDVAKMRAMSKCMREHGITDFPDPDPNGDIKIEGRKGGNGIDPSSQTFRNAQKSCEKLGPGGGGLSSGSSAGGAATSGSGG